ncbi:MAG: hypothetical protein ACXAEU_11325 [Candidatus Hodarchaeales archaeon]|jgi:hypothetical protein
MTTHQRQSHKHRKFAEDIASIYQSEEKSKLKKDILRKKKRLANKNGK